MPMLPDASTTTFCSWPMPPWPWRAMSPMLILLFAGSTTCGSSLGGKPWMWLTFQMGVEGLTETHQTFQGTASWYGPAFHGRQTATGEIFNQHALTAAHPSLPFGTQLKVRNLLNDRTVVIRINDRGPYIGDRSLDLSKAAAQCLGSESTGVIPYEATVLMPLGDQPDGSDSLLVGFQAP
ncbi:septal ring lytic transglycosylase RlpA family protein [Halomicronema hongdechloris]|uniref:septal ring lytic transglycosylase RlpA family protein n=1 Tax=Halomicronema hongdechloris TaxID=1209493 RepID=UPI001930FACE|nr:septal ring lytic transglycosylase RlpA family protein [Halomicronema hongdechloris]